MIKIYKAGKIYYFYKLYPYVSFCINGENKKYIAIPEDHLFLVDLCHLSVPIGKYQDCK